jgi:hypothetical protein
MIERRVTVVPAVVVLVVWFQAGVMAQLTVQVRQDKVSMVEIVVKHGTQVAVEVPVRKVMVEMVVVVVVTL